MADHVLFPGKPKYQVVTVAVDGGEKDVTLPCVH